MDGPAELAELGIAFNGMAGELGRLFDAQRELVVHASHDLRTPLASLQAMLEAVEDGLAPPETYLPTMHQQVRHLSGLVDDLFELARIDAGALTLELREVRLDSLVEGCVRGVEASAEARGVRVESRVAPAVPAVRCAPEQMERVLLNLLTNALRHTPSNAQFFERGGRLLVHDVNLRPPASIGLALRAGFDGPALGIAATLGDSTGLAQPHPPPFTYVSAEGEAHIVATRLRENGRGAAARHAASMVTAGLPGGRMLDPPLWDISWFGARAGRVARQVGANGAGRGRRH